MLGENIVEAIRFSVMKQHDYGAVVLDRKTLTTGEASVLGTPMGFLEKKRIIILIFLIFFFADLDLCTELVQATFMCLVKGNLIF